MNGIALIVAAVCATTVIREHGVGTAKERTVPKKTTTTTGHQFQRSLSMDEHKCRWCGRPDEGNAGDYYHEKQCHRQDVLRRMDELSMRGGTFYEMEKLQRELAEASYTGD